MQEAKLLIPLLPPPGAEELHPSSEPLSGRARTGRGGRERQPGTSHQTHLCSLLTPTGAHTLPTHDASRTGASQQPAQTTPQGPQPQEPWQRLLWARGTAFLGREPSSREQSPSQPRPCRPLGAAGTRSAPAACGRRHPRAGARSRRCAGS